MYGSLQLSDSHPNIPRIILRDAMLTLDQCSEDELRFLIEAIKKYRHMDIMIICLPSDQNILRLKIIT